MSLNSFSFYYIETFAVCLNEPGITVNVSGSSFGNESIETNLDGCAYFLVTESETLTISYTIPIMGLIQQTFDFTFSELGNISLLEIDIPSPRSEVKTIKINRECAKQSLPLTWLNSLGGWEYWNFTAKKTFGVDNFEAEIIERDIFQDWDNEFINGQTQYDIISRKDRKSVVVRTQQLTSNEVDAIKNIRKSIKVQDITDVTKPVTVIIDPSSFQYFTDREKLVTLEFKILYPNLITQKQ